MIAAPRCWTLAMNSPRSHSSSPMTSGAGRPPIVACQASGNWVDEWLPQMARSRTSRTRTPAFAASWDAAATLVEHGHGEPSVLRHAVARRRGGADERVRVARVADDEHAAVLGGVARDRGALAGEDAAVDAEQVLALHPLACAGPRRRAAPSWRRGRPHRCRRCRRCSRAEERRSPRAPFARRRGPAALPPARGAGARPACPGPNAAPDARRKRSA